MVLFLKICTVYLVLEGEMYQLSHILTEEKSLMSAMMEMSLVSDKGNYGNCTDIRLSDIKLKEFRLRHQN